MHLIPQRKYASILYAAFSSQELAARGICLADVRVSDTVDFAIRNGQTKHQRILLVLES